MRFARELLLYGVLGNSEARGRYSLSQKFQKRSHTLLKFIVDSSAHVIMRANVRIYALREGQKPAMRQEGAREA